MTTLNTQPIQKIKIYFAKNYGWFYIDNVIGCSEYFDSIDAAVAHAKTNHPGAIIDASEGYP